MWKSESYVRDDYDELIELIKENYGMEALISKNDYLVWRYNKNPFGKAVIEIARNDKNGELAGQYVVIPNKFQIDGKAVLGTLSLDTLTKKEYRGQGIFTGLAEEVYNDCKENNLGFTLGFPNQSSYPGFLKKLKFEDIGELTLLCRPFDVEKIIQYKFGTPLSKLGCIFPYLYKSTNLNAEKIVEIDDKNIELFDEFWTLNKNKYRIIGERNSSFMKWRYLEAPYKDYKIWGIVENGRLKGYVVGLVTDFQGIRSGIIVDTLLGDANKKSIDMLFKTLFNYFAESKIALAVTLINSNSEEYRVIRKKHFITCPKFIQPQPFPVIFRPHTEAMNKEIMHDFSNWYLTLGDYDIF